MSTQRLLLKTSVSDLQAMTLLGQPVTGSFERISGFLREHVAGRPVQPFAQPVDSGATVTWYGEASHDPVALTALPVAQRTTAELQLERVLATVDPLLDDPETGPLLRRALIVPSLDSVLVSDDGVVLTNWGYAPQSIGNDTEALARHVAAVFGPFSPRLAAIDARYFDQVRPAGSNGATVVMPGVTRSVLPPFVRGAPAGAPPPPRSAAFPSPSQPAPGFARVHLYWLAPLLSLVAAVFLVMGFWLAWMHFAGDLAGRTYNAALVDENRTRVAIQVQRQTNVALERDLERARRALEAANVCTPEAPGGVAPLPERQPIQPNSVPAPVPPRQGQAPAPFAGSLADLLERATVWIVVATPSGIGSGSGFFISGDTILTNAHVVEKADPDGKIYITSKALGSVLTGTVIASTSRAAGAAGARAGMADFAAIRLNEPAAGAQPLALSEHAEKLSDVVAAGYPTSVIRHEEAVQELRQGKLTGAPELVLTRGSVSSVQRLPNGIVILPHSADISGGNSGGPLVDACGNVLGINSFVTAAERFVDRTKYALKTDSFLPWLRENNIAVQVTSAPCQPAAPTAMAAPRAGPEASPPGAAPAVAPAPPVATSPPAPGSASPPGTGK